jgi:hypothetical protein
MTGILHILQKSASGGGRDIKKVIMWMGWILSKYIIFMDVNITMKPLCTINLYYKFLKVNLNLISSKRSYSSSKSNLPFSNIYRIYSSISFYIEVYVLVLISPILSYGHSAHEINNQRFVRWIIEIHEVQKNRQYFGNLSYSSLI